MAGRRDRSIVVSVPVSTSLPTVTAVIDVAGRCGMMLARTHADQPRDEAVGQADGEVGAGAREGAEHARVRVVELDPGGVHRAEEHGRRLRRRQVVRDLAVVDPQRWGARRRHSRCEDGECGGEHEPERHRSGGFLERWSGAEWEQRPWHRWKWAASI